MPPFDPLKLTSDAADKGDAPPDAAPPQDDTEVAFTSRDISAADIAAVAGELTLAEAQAQVVESINAQAAAGRAPLPLAAAADADAHQPRRRRSARRPRLRDDRRRRAERAVHLDRVRMVPENVTNAPRSRRRRRRSRAERLVAPATARRSRTCCGRTAPPQDAIAAILAAFGAEARRAPGRRRAEGHPAISPTPTDPAAGADRPRLDLHRRTAQATVAVDDDGDYVAGRRRRAPRPRKPRARAMPTTKAA